MSSPFSSLISSGLSERNRKVDIDLYSEILTAMLLIIRGNWKGKNEGGEISITDEP